MNSFQITTNANDIVTLTVTFILKIAILDFIAVGGICVSQAQSFYLSNALYSTGAKRLYVPDGTQNQYGWRQRARFSIRIFAGVYIHL